MQALVRLRALARLDLRLSTRLAAGFGLMLVLVQGIRRIAASGAGEKVQGAPKDGEAQAEIRRLQSQLALLAAAHAGLIRSVQLAGGMAALERFWKDYKAVCDAVHAHSGMAPASNVVHLATAPRDPATTA